MKHLLKVAHYKWVSGSQKEMMYKDNNDEWFVGSPYNVVIGETYVVEISNGVLEDGYRHIIKFK